MSFFSNDAFIKCLRQCDIQSPLGQGRVSGESYGDKVLTGGGRASNGGLTRDELEMTSANIDGAD